jgi:raffinose/stachyose/melibiose transport system permease protein
MTEPSTSIRYRVASAATRLLIWGYALGALAPLLLMLIGSLRSSRSLYDHPLGLPDHVELANYRRAWTQASFSTYLFNSIIVTVGAVLLGTAVSLLAAYPLGRWTFRARGMIAAYFLAGLLLPAQAGIVPLFYLLESLRLIDSRLGLVLVYAATGVPFAVFVLSAFFRQLPGELEEAAVIDGAGVFTTFWKVLTPLVRPGVVTVVIFQFVPLWNDFFYPLVLLRSDAKYTMPVGLTYFFGEFKTDWGALFAGLVMTAVPLVVLFTAATKHVVAGLTAGMSKG